MYTCALRSTLDMLLAFTLLSRDLRGRPPASYVACTHSALIQRFQKIRSSAAQAASTLRF
eukprot:15454014-Alexandrium_andersonii.AAC.1